MRTPDGYNERIDHWFDRWFPLFWGFCFVLGIVFWVAVIWLIVVLIQHFG